MRAISSVPPLEGTFAEDGSAEMSMSSGDPYEVLGVRRDASQEEVQAAYRRRAKDLHPDLRRCLRRIPKAAFL